MAWRFKSEYHRTTAIGGRRHGEDAEYLYVPHLKNFWMQLMLSQPGTLWPFQTICKLWLARLRGKT
jgi:hypothetical protein